MKSSLLFFFLFLFSCLTIAEEINLNNDILFKGVTKQSTDYSCGAAALSTLITGLVENSHVTENDVMKTIAESSKSNKADGYTLVDLMNVSTKLGYYAEWQKVSTKEIDKIHIPVMLLIGLNSSFPHFVVLKGIDNGEAFLADSIRGNIRVPYKQLVKEGISDQFKDWFVMAIEPSANIPKDSNLYLSTDKYDTHFTPEQSGAITLSTLPQANQLFVNYDFLFSAGTLRDGTTPARSRELAHSLSVRYGITKDIEIGSRFNYVDDRFKVLDNNSTIIGQSSRSYELFANHRFALDDNNQNGIIAGLTGSFVEQNNIWAGGFNALGYTNTTFAQFILGGMVSKQFSSNDAIDHSLPEYQVTGFISANKPFADRYLGSLAFYVNDGHRKYTDVNEVKRSYITSLSLTYVVNQYFQVAPSFNYTFGNGDIFTVGASVTYTGGW